MMTKLGNTVCKLTAFISRGAYVVVWKVNIWDIENKLNIKSGAA
jgi:hypothetical protein